MNSSSGSSLVLRADNAAATNFIMFIGACTVAAGLLLLLASNGTAWLVCVGFAVVGSAIMAHARGRHRSIDTYTFNAATQGITAQRSKQVYRFADITRIVADRDWLDAGLVADVHAAHWLTLHTRDGARLCVAHDYRWRLDQLLLQLRDLGLQPHDAPPAALHTCRVINLPRAKVR
jgi:hypothetical protein